MHIEPGIVEGSKILLSVGTAVAAIGLAGKMAIDTLKKDGDIVSLAIRSVITTALVFCFFQVLPHYPVGVSEVHFILGSTLFLIFGAGPASIGLALGLLVQGVFFAPMDLPQYGMNVTTLLVPMFAMSVLAKRLIPAKTAYKDVSYLQALSLSTAFQAGTVGWVAFWAVYGQGFGAESLTSIGSFGAAYMTVILLEPLVDLAILAVAKNLPALTGAKMFNYRLHQAET